MSKRIYETKAQRMFRNAVKNELENTAIKFLLSTVKPLHKGWLSGISAALEDDLMGFL